MLVKLKTETKTLEQIAEILSKNPDGNALIKQAFIDTVNKLHLECFSPEHPTLLLVDDAQFKVKVKSEHKEFMQELTGHKGPYQVNKTLKSWVGLSEGVYAIEGCDKFIPVSWCKKAPKVDRTTILAIFLALSSLVQSGAILLLLL